MSRTNPHINVWISPEGQITLDAVGFTGNTCAEATRFLEEELGTVGRKQRTRDWYRPQANQNQQTNRIGEGGGEEPNGLRCLHFPGILYFVGSGLRCIVV